MGGLDVPWDTHPLQGTGTPHPRALDGLSLLVSMTMRTKVQVDGLD